MIVAHGPRMGWGAILLLCTVGCASAPAPPSAMARVVAHEQALKDLQSLCVVRYELGGRGVYLYGLEPSAVDECLTHAANLVDLVSLSVEMGEAPSASGKAGGPLARISTLRSLRKVVVTRITLGEAEWAALHALPRLEQLHVVSVGLEDGTAGVLSGFQGLRELNLAFNPVGDATLEYVKELVSLGRLSVVGTEVTAEGVARLLEARPRMVVETDEGLVLGKNATE